jgi:hypothetical protein
MGWTNPLTATYLGYLTEGVWNTHVRDNLLALRNEVPYCIAWASSAVSLPSSTWTAITFPTDQDNAGMHDNATNNSRITFTEAGTYEIHAQLCVEAMPATTSIGVRFLSNGSYALGTIYALAANTNGTGVASTTFNSSSVNDYIEMQGWQNDESSKNTTAWDTLMYARRIAS